MALVCIPWGGAGAVPFRAWCPLIGQTASVYAARLAGREARFRESLPAQLSTVVEELTEAVAGLAEPQVTLFGHCSGAIIAFEIARALRGSGTSALARLIVAAQLGPRALAGSPPGPDPQESIPEHLRGEPEFAELLVSVVAADMRMISNYEYVPAEPLDVPITVISGGRDATVTRDELAGWRAETTQETQWREVEHADHLFSGDAWLLLAEQVRDVLAGRGSRGRPAIQERGQSGHGGMHKEVDDPQAGPAGAQLLNHPDQNG
jgi:surfactin synthase thioesterase subunit